MNRTRYGGLAGMKCRRVEHGLLLAVLGAVFVAGPAAHARGSWPRPRTLLEVRSVDAFAQDGNHIAWMDASQPCPRLVQLQNLTTGVTTPLARRSGPTCGELEIGFGPGDLALSGTRALWSYTAGLGQLDAHYIAFSTAAPGSRERDVGGWDLSEGPPKASMDGDGHTLVYAAVGVGGGVVRVTRRGVGVPDTGSAGSVAASGRRFALWRHRRAGCVCNEGPEWSPDGTKVAFRGARRGGDNAGELYVIDADRGNLRMLVASRRLRLTLLGWDAAGDSTFYSDGLAVWSVDLTGRRRRILGVRGRGGELSPDRRFLLYRASHGHSDRDTLEVGVIATGERRALVEEEDFSWTGWSPDSSAIAYRSAGMLRVIAASGGTPRTLATGLATSGAFFHEPAWSPNSHEIAFDRDGGISVLDTGTGSERQLVTGATGLVGWAPDGGSLAFWRLDRPGGYVTGLYVVAVDGTNERRVAGFGSDATWSLDSTQLAFDGGDQAIHVADASGAAERRLVEGLGAIWSPNSQRLAYVSSGEIAVVNRDGSGARALTRTDPEPDRYPVEVHSSRTGARLASFEAGRGVDALALDGKRVALLTGKGRDKRIEVRRANGRLLRRLAVPARTADEVSIAGRWVVFRTGRRTIHVLDLRSGSTSVLTVTAGSVVGLSLDRRRVAWGEQLAGHDRIRAIVLPK